MNTHEKYLKYHEMCNNCDNIQKAIIKHMKAEHIELLSYIDVFVADEETEKYFVDFERRGKTGYKHIRSNFTISELKKYNIIGKTEEI